MLNQTCSFDEPLGYTIIHYVCTAISFPMYGIAFFILIFKSPSYFDKYRNYLISHICSGVLLEVHMGMLWKVTVVLPIPIMCSNSIAAEFAPNVFQFLPLCLIYTGASILSLFIYRMETVAFTQSGGYLRKMVFHVRYLFFISIFAVIIFTVLIYPDLKWQKEYKMKMEQRFGEFENYMWCDNCFFFNFDSTLFRWFFDVSLVATLLGTTTGALALLVTIKCLKSVKTQISSKSAALHRNFLISLVFTAAIHGVCILIPLLGFLWAISFVISLSQFPYFPFIMVLIIQEHGAASTITMFLTNNLLRRSAMKMFCLDQTSESISQSRNVPSTTVN